MIMIEINVMDGRGKIKACVATYGDADRINSLCRWADKQDEALESLREAAQAVVKELDDPIAKHYIAVESFDRLRAELEGVGKS